MFRLKVKTINADKGVYSVRPTIPNLLIWCSPYLVIGVLALIGPLGMKPTPPAEDLDKNDTENLPLDK